MMRLVPYFLFSIFLLQASLSAQYLDVRLMDQLRQQVYLQEVPDDSPLLEEATAQLKSELSEERINYLNESIRPIPVERYADIFGSPYYFKEFSKAQLIDAGGKHITLGPLNYNAYSKRFEFKSEDAHFQFLSNYYPQVRLTHNGVLQTFILGLLPGLQNDYAHLAFDGDLIKAAIHLNVTSIKNEGFSGGVNTAKNRFGPAKSLYIWHQGRWVRSAFKVKTIAKELGREKEIKAFVKKNKLNLKDNTDLLQLMTYVNELMENNQ